MNDIEEICDRSFAQPYKSLFFRCFYDIKDLINPIKKVCWNELSQHFLAFG